MNWTDILIALGGFIAGLLWGGPLNVAITSFVIRRKKRLPKWLKQLGMELPDAQNKNVS